MPKLIEERLQRLEDQLALQDLLARYSFNADLGRTREYADLFTSDGELDLSEMGLGVFRGRESIHDDFITQPAAAAAAGRTFHHQAPTVFYVDGETATGEGYSSVLYADENGSISCAGATNNLWSFRRVDGEWRISGRKVRVLGSPQAEEIYETSIR